MAMIARMSSWIRHALADLREARGRRQESGGVGLFASHGGNEANTSSPKRAWRRLLRIKGVRRAGCAMLVCVLLVPAGWLALPLVPLPAELFGGRDSDLEFVDRYGQSLRVVRPDNESFHRRIEYGEIPADLVRATLAAEDGRFWDHPGVDWRASLRAAGQWISHLRVISGGSTITQQLIKLAQPRPRTLRTKLIEAVQALRLEQVWDKQKILAAYLDRLDYGNFNQGCAAAAQFYFAKPLRDLSPAECAFLAGLPQAPSRLNPRTHLDRACKRQQWVLGRMRQGGWLTEEQYLRAAAEPLHLAAPRRSFEAPHFVDLLLATEGVAWRSAQRGQTDSTRAGGKAEPSRGAATFAGPIRTTLDLTLNRFAEEVLRRHLQPLKLEHVANGAVVVLDNRSGGVLALVGSEDYFAPTAGQVNGAWSARSTGSALKPFTYLLALEHGATPATIVADVPTEFATATGLFEPVNYDRRCYGPVRYRVALANSLNISAVKVLASIGGAPPLQQFLRQCGLTTLRRSAEDYGLGLTIGNGEARLLELANAYACLARLGVYKPYRLVLDSPGRPQPDGGHAVADPAAAFLIADMLSDNDARTLAFGAESPLRFDFPVACKTGTSSDFRDNWAFGYTPEFTVGIWVGNFDGSPMRHVSGVTGAGPILHDVFEYLHQQKGTTWFSTPTNIVEDWIHPLTGKRLSARVPLPSNAIKEKFIATKLPPLESADDYVTVPDGPWPTASSANAGSAKAQPLETFGPEPLPVVRLANEYRDWFASADNLLGSSVALAPGKDPLRVVFPPAGTIFYLDPDLPQQGRRIRLRAAGADTLQWQCDSLQLTFEGDSQTALLTQGRHQLTVRDPVTGEQAQTWIDVMAR